VRLPSTPLNPVVFLAVIAAVGVWFLLWRTRLGYELRTVGANPDAAVYGGIRVDRIIIIAMLISGALAGLLSVNEIMGFQHRIVLEFVGGAGFVGIAVSLLGRSHPLGVILAALLFGILYQGGAELSFQKPTISRDMFVVIQGLVIRFMGALEQVFKPHIARLLAPRIVETKA
jgi:simple sugar transport system permease protein